MRLTICHVSTFRPTQCGIASYTEDLIGAMPKARHRVVAVEYGEPPPMDEAFVLMRMPIADSKAHLQAARTIEASDANVVSLQHEFGIYGGPDGRFLLRFLRQLKKPMVTTLHTVNDRLSPERVELLRQIFRKSRYVVVLSERSAEICRRLFPRMATRIRVIEHGVHPVTFRWPNETAMRAEIGGTIVFVSSGHLAAHKGYEEALQALHRLHLDGVDFRYLILGRGQAQFGGAEEVEERVAALVERLGLAAKVIRIREFLQTDRLLECFEAADVGLVTYTRANHNSSGVLSALLACGRPVIATDFEFARDIAERTDSVALARIGDVDDLYRAISAWVTRAASLPVRMRRAYTFMEPLHWPKVGSRYEKLFVSATTPVEDD